MASSFQVLSSSHRFCGSTIRLSLPNLNSYGDGSVTLFWPGLKTLKRAKSLCLYATPDENNENDGWSEFKISSDRIKKAAMVMQIQELITKTQIFEKEFVGYSDDTLVEATLNGARAPVRVEIAEAALKLGAKELSIMVHQAYKHAHNLTILSMRQTIRKIMRDLGVETEGFLD